MVSGGTDNHLILLNLTDKGMTGKELEHMLDEVHITVNKNAVPFDKMPPSKTSGIRVGTPAVTTRGMSEEQMKIIADCIADAVTKGESAKQSIISRVVELTASFPLYK